MSWLSALTGVLMVGHSLIGPDQPAMLEQMLAAGGHPVSVEAQIINGAPLQWNWSHGPEAEGIDARARLARGGIGALILTEAVPLANHLQWSDSAGQIALWSDAARMENPDIKVFVLETWHSLNSGTGAPVAYDDGAGVPWRQRLDDDLPAWQALAGDAVLIPAGQAMGQLSDAIISGTVPGLSDISDLFADDIHPNAIGHYFVALVSYAALTEQSPVGLPLALKDHYGGAFPAPDARLGQRLQEIAGEVVADLSGVTFAPVADRLAANAPPAAATPTPPRATSIPAMPDGMAIGLAGIDDWSTQQPFLDVMKAARPWIGHLPGQWGGVEYLDLLARGLLDADGWPKEKPGDLSAIGTVILTDLPAGATSSAGQYRLRFDGKGIVEPKGRATNIRYGRNEVTFSFTPGPGLVDLRIQRSDPADPVRNITVVQQDHAAAFDAGAVFNPDWIARLDGFAVVRFMDWMATNSSLQSAWADRPRPGDFSFAIKGVPVEVMLELANTLNADPWFNMPHLADDAYVTGFAEMVRDGLAPGRRAFVEFSNEVWNWQFEQAAWADAMAQERWGARDAWVQFYAVRAAEVAALWSDVLPRDRLVNVLGTQTGWLGLEDVILNAPLYMAENPANLRPAEAFDAYAVTGYFGGFLGTSERADMVQDWLAQSRARDPGRPFAQAITLAAQELLDGSVNGQAEDTLADLLSRVLPYHARIARENGLALVMYEGGTHAVGIGPMVDNEALSEFLIALNYSDEMGALYSRLVDGWRDLGGELFNAFVDVQAPTKWGSWGALRHLDDENPRWNALLAGQ